MRRSFTILAAIGMLLTCVIILGAILAHQFMRTGTMIHIGQFGSIGFLLFRDGIYVTWHGIRKSHFNLYYVATLTAALPMAYLNLDASRRRATRRRRFSVIAPEGPPDR
jgi:hypothetical protein